MHAEVVEYIRKVREEFPAFFSNVRVLDCGSLDINGNNRWAFADTEYTGLDILDGDNVDVVSDVATYAHMHQGEYDVVICTEMLEHDAQYENSLTGFLQLLRPYGLLLITCAGTKRAEHGTHSCNPQDSPATLDYYRNIDRTDILTHYGNGEFITFSIEEGRDGQDLYFSGIRR